ncbi:MAG: Ig-like domain-containing protein [Clostridiales bacterium]|jgi:hypothetical protein|nr:Ig-like domain-containing protein [Clostridiales bacterium]
MKNVQINSARFRKAAVAVVVVLSMAAAALALLLSGRGKTAFADAGPGEAPGLFAVKAYTGTTSQNGGNPMFGFNRPLPGLGGQAGYGMCDYMRAKPSRVGFDGQASMRVKKANQKSGAYDPFEDGNPAVFPAGEERIFLPWEDGDIVQQNEILKFLSPSIYGGMEFEPGDEIIFPKGMGFAKLDGSGDGTEFWDSVLTSSAVFRYKTKSTASEAGEWVNVALTYASATKIMDISETHYAVKVSFTHDITVDLSGAPTVFDTAELSKVTLGGENPDGYETDPNFPEDITFAFRKADIPSAPAAFAIERGFTIGDYPLLDEAEAALAFATKINIAFETLKTPGDPYAFAFCFSFADGDSAYSGNFYAVSKASPDVYNYIKIDGEPLGKNNGGQSFAQFSNECHLFSVTPPGANFSVEFLPGFSLVKNAVEIFHSPLDGQMDCIRGYPTGDALERGAIFRKRSGDWYGGGNTYSKEDWAYRYTDTDIVFGFEGASVSDGGANWKITYNFNDPVAYADPDPALYAAVKNKIKIGGSDLQALAASVSGAASLIVTIPKTKLSSADRKLFVIESGIEFPSGNVYTGGFGKYYIQSEDYFISSVPSAELTRNPSKKLVFASGDNFRLGMSGTNVEFIVKFTGGAVVSDTDYWGYSALPQSQYANLGGTRTEASVDYALSSGAYAGLVDKLFVGATYGGAKSVRTLNSETGDPSRVGIVYLGSEFRMYMYPGDLDLREDQVVVLKQGFMTQQGYWLDKEVVLAYDHVTQKVTADIDMAQFTISGGPNISVAVNQKYLISYTVTPADTAPANREIIWQSDNSAVAAVTSAGEIIGLSSGSAVITGTPLHYPGLARTLNVTVTYVALDGISFNVTEKTLLIGQTYTVEPIFTPTNASIKDIKYASNDDCITVTPNGVVMSVKKGEAVVTVTAADGGLAAAVKITVLNQVEFILIAETPDKTRYYADENFSRAGIKVIAVMDDGEEIEIPAADLDIYGFVKGKSGEQTITVDYAFKTASYAVTVIEGDAPGASGGDTPGAGGGCGSVSASGGGAGPGGFMLYGGATLLLAAAFLNGKNRRGKRPNGKKSALI